MEAEGSGPIGSLDEGSGSGDIVGNEDLLRVSIKGLGGWCWGPEREGCRSGSSDCRLAPWELLAFVCGSHHTLSFTSYMFDIFNTHEPGFVLRALFATFLLPWNQFLSPS